MSYTQSILDMMPDINMAYLTTLRGIMRRAKEDGRTDMYNSYKNVGKGYIKALCDCGIYEQNHFRILYNWFAL